MAIKKTVALAATNLLIEDIKDVLYNNTNAKKIILEGGRVGYMNPQVYADAVKNWPTDEDDNLMLPSSYRLSSRGYWTDAQRTTGMGVESEIVLPGEKA